MGDWNLIGRTNKKVMKTLKARELWEKIGYAAWASADPGLHFNSTMNDWHTCKASGDIRASNPCSNTCSWTTPPATWRRPNLLTFYNTTTKQFGRRLLRASLPTLDAGARNLGDDGAIPSKAIAELSYEFPHPSVLASPISAVS